MRERYTDALTNKNTEWKSVNMLTLQQVFIESISSHLNAEFSSWWWLYTYKIYDQSLSKFVKWEEKKKQSFHSAARRANYHQFHLVTFLMNVCSFQLMLITSCMHTSQLAWRKMYDSVETGHERMSCCESMCQSSKIFYS